jgi:hypothetical protein
VVWYVYLFMEMFETIKRLVDAELSGDDEESSEEMERDDSTGGMHEDEIVPPEWAMPTDEEYAAAVKDAFGWEIH